MASVTPKQEKFAQAIVGGKSQSEAYRIAYNAQNMKAETVHKRSGELMKSGAVTGRVEELRKPVVEEIQVSLKRHLEDLLELRDAAKNAEKYGPAIQAEISRGKASGLYVENVRHSGTVILQVSPMDEDL